MTDNAAALAGSDTRRGHRWWRRIAVALIVAFAALLIVPLVWPVPPLADTVPPALLADERSRFVDIDGLTVHYETWGFDATADEIPLAFVLLHGFGASTFSWRAVSPVLAERMPVVGFDRPGFGLTERPLRWAGPDPYSPVTQADLTVRLMDRLGIRRAVLVGHSAGGAVALLAAERHPERVAALVLEAPAIFAGGPPAALTPLLRTPQLRRIGPLLSRRLAGRAGDEFLRRAWYDPSLITSETLRGYRRPLRATDWDRALWSVTIAERPRDLPARLSRLSQPVLFITGDDDRIVPPTDTERAAALVAGARLVTIPQSGHIPHEERPERFTAAVLPFVERVSGGGR